MIRKYNVILLFFFFCDARTSRIMSFRIFIRPRPKNYILFVYTGRDNRLLITGCLPTVGDGGGSLYKSFWLLWRDHILLYVIRQ